MKFKSKKRVLNPRLKPDREVLFNRLLEVTHSFNQLPDWEKGYVAALVGHTLDSMDRK